jgi:hypothetical protein
VAYIADGRKSLATDGHEHEGRISYEQGLSMAMAAFKEAKASGDAETLVLVEHAFLTRELEFCNKDDKESRDSMTKAIASFDDALRAIKAVENPAGYKVAEQTYPLDKNYRVGGFPKDAFHLACIAHRIRLRNYLSPPGATMTEKSIYKQRRENLTAMQDVYHHKQHAALAETAHHVGTPVALSKR